MRVQHNKTLMPHCSEIIRIGRLALLMVFMGVSGSCHSVGGETPPPSGSSVIVRWPVEWGIPSMTDDVTKDLGPCDLTSSMNRVFSCSFTSPHNKPFILEFSKIKRKANVNISTTDITLNKRDLLTDSPSAQVTNSQASYSIIFPKNYYAAVNGKKRIVDLLTASDQKPCKSKILYPDERKIVFSRCSNVQQGVLTEFILRLKDYEDESFNMAESLSEQEFTEKLKLKPKHPSTAVNTDPNSRSIEFPKSEYDRLKNSAELDNVKLFQENDVEPCPNNMIIDDIHYKITFHDCDIIVEPDGSTQFYLEVPDKGRSKKIVMKESWPEDKYNGLWLTQSSANPIVNQRSVTVQFPELLYKALKKYPDKVRLYPEDDDKQACKNGTQKDNERKITFECPDIQGRTPSFFYLKIAGFDKKLIPLGSKHTEAEPFKVADDLSTKFISIGNEGRQLPLILNQIGQKQLLNETETLCKQSYTVTYAYLFNLDQNSQPVPVETDAHCHPIKVSWPKAWGEPTIAQASRNDAQKISCDDSQDLPKQTCNYFTKASDHFMLEWKNGLITTRVDLKDQLQTHEIKSLSIRVPKDEEGILKGHLESDNKASWCEQEPTFEFQNIQVCNSIHQCMAIESSAVLSFNWSDPSFPAELKGSFVQKTQNPKYAQSVEKAIPIGDHYALPKKAELQASQPKQLPVEIDFDPSGQKTEYNDRRELLLFKSEQDCIKTEKPVRNVYYTEPDIKALKLPACEENWAKVTAEGRQSNLTQCALGKITTSSPTAVNFKLKEAPTYGVKRWLIVVSETRGLDQQKRNIIEALKVFIKNNDKQPITIIASGAKVRKLLRAEEVASDFGEKILWGSIAMNNTIQDAILNLDGIQSEIPLEKIQRLLYITDSTGLNSNEDVNTNQRTTLGKLITWIPMTVVTPKNYCDFWKNKAKVKHCEDISDISKALAEFKED